MAVLSLPERWLTLDTAARITRLQPSEIAAAIDAGELRAALVDGQAVIHRAWLRTWRESYEPRAAAARDFRMAAAHDDGDAAA